MNLISFSKLISKQRNSLSLFFEPIENNQRIRIHKVYYRAEEMDMLAYSNILTKLDCSETIREITHEELHNSIVQLRNQQRAFSETPQLLNSLNNINFEDEDLIRAEHYINRLNDIFFHYRFSLVSKHFVFDSISQEIQNKIEITDFNPGEEFDFREKEKPFINCINPGEEKDYELRVYNVGQANCSALIKHINRKTDDYKVVVVFDLGYQKVNGKNDSLNEMISRIDYDTTIIISHFHRDHINNIVNHCNIKTNRWVFPSCDPSRHKAYKLFQALLLVAQKKTYSGRVYVFPTPYSFSLNLIVHQHKGKAIDRFQNGDDVNAQSLVCELKIGDKRVLIPGDALYDEYDSLILDTPFDYVLIPHHCCLYSSDSSTSLSSKIRGVIRNNTFGIVNCGVNSYGHANISHLSWYKDYYLFNGSKIFDDMKTPIYTSHCIKKDYFSIKFK